MRKTYVSRLRRTEDICQCESMRARTVVDICQNRARNEDMRSSSPSIGSTVTINERRLTAGISSEALREMSFSELPSFMDGLQLFQEDVLASAYSTLGFEPLYRFHLIVSKVFKEGNLTYLESDAIRRHAGKSAQEQRPLSEMWMSILRAVKLMFAAPEGDSSVFGPRIDCLYRESSFRVNRFSFSSRVRVTLEQKDYLAFDFVAPFVCGFIYYVTGYTICP